MDATEHITGGGSGIGRAVAAFSNANAPTLRFCFCPNMMTRARPAGLSKRKDNRPARLPENVGDRAFWFEAVEKVMTAFGKIDLVISNWGEQQDSSYMSGQVLHPNGGTVVNG